MTVRVGLVGVGRMGSVLARHLVNGVPEASLVAIADLDRAKAEEMASQYGADSVYSDPLELFERRDVGAVLIVTPTDTHPDLVAAAAAAGKHVFVEKPLALTLDGCDRAIAAAAAAGVKLMVGFMRRFDPAYREARSKVETGAIGRPTIFKSIDRDPVRTSLEFARRESSGGLIMDMGVHDFDLARWLMSSEVVRVSSEGACLAYPELREAWDIDNAVVNLRFADGAVGNVDLSRNAVYGFDARTEVLGTSGAVMVGRQRESDLLLLSAPGAAGPTGPGRFDAAYVEEIRHFVDCVAQDRTPMVTGSEARLATAIAIAATVSLDEGRPVELREVLSGPEELIPWKR
jgi:inositol 2-dehydrogenase